MSSMMSLTKVLNYSVGSIKMLVATEVGVLLEASEDR